MYQSCYLHQCLRARIREIMTWNRWHHHNQIYIDDNIKRKSPIIGIKSHTHTHEHTHHKNQKKKSHTFDFASLLRRLIIVCHLHFLAHCTISHVHRPIKQHRNKRKLSRNQTYFRTFKQLYWAFYIQRTKWKHQVSVQWMTFRMQCSNVFKSNRIQSQALSDRCWVMWMDAQSAETASVCVTLILFRCPNKV